MARDRIKQEQLYYYLDQINMVSKKQYTFSRTYGGWKLIATRWGTEITPYRMTKRERCIIFS